MAPGERFEAITFPGAEAVRGVPLLGPIYSELISGHCCWSMSPSGGALHLVGAVPHRFGLRLRAVGENPPPSTAGILAWLRYRAVICTGVLTGIAGAYLAMVQNAGFVKDMTPAVGYIALAALIFAKWKPVNAMFACLLFGFLDALSIRLQGAPLPVIGKVPVQFMQALPWLLTVILLAGFIGKAIPPRRRRALCEGEVK